MGRPGMLNNERSCARTPVAHVVADDFVRHVQRGTPGKAEVVHVLGTRCFAGVIMEADSLPVAQKTTSRRRTRRRRQTGLLRPSHKCFGTHLLTNSMDGMKDFAATCTCLLHDTFPVRTAWHSVNSKVRVEGQSKIVRDVGPRRRDRRFTQQRRCLQRKTQCSNTRPVHLRIICNSRACAASVLVAPFVNRHDAVDMVLALVVFGTHTAHDPVRH